MPKIIYVTISIFLLISCTKEVTLDLADREGTNIVVEAIINDEPGVKWVRLSYTNSYYEEGNTPAVSEAIVEIVGNNSTYVFIESTNQDSLGYYYNYEIANELVETVYILNVIVGDETYFAESEFNTVPVLDSIAFLKSPFNDFANANLQPGEDSVYVFDIYVYFPYPGVEQYYMFERYLNQEHRTPRPSDKILLDSRDLQGYVSYSVSTHSTNSHEIGDTVAISIHSISEELFDFYLVYFNQTDLSGNPFAGAPPANIPTNLSEGALGFFQLSSVKTADKIFNY